LRRTSTKEWTAEEVGRTLSTNTESASYRLADFHSLGLIRAKSAEGKLYYRYAPDRADLDATIGELAEVYEKYPVRVINLIFSKPIERIKTFADAFRIRKKEDE
jgi:hypothetical protein